MSNLCSIVLQFNVDEEGKPVKYYKNPRFWKAVTSILVTELLLIAAIIMVVRYRHYRVIWFEWWRWLFFFSGDISSESQRSVCFGKAPKCQSSVLFKQHLDVLGSNVLETCNALNAGFAWQSVFYNVHLLVDSNRCCYVLFKDLV